MVYPPMSNSWMVPEDRGYRVAQGDRGDQVVQGDGLQYPGLHGLMTSRVVAAVALAGYHTCLILQAVGGKESTINDNMRALD